MFAPGEAVHFRIATSRRLLVQILGMSSFHEDL